MTALQAPMARVRAAGSVNVLMISVRVAGGQDRAAHALHRAGGDQQGAAGGEAARERGEGEGGEAGEEGPLGADEVGQPAAEQQESGEAECVGIDDPLLAHAGEVQLLAHGREGHVHDRHIEDDHELRGARQGQDRGGGPGGGGGPVVAARALPDRWGDAVACMRASLPAKAKLEVL
ncbi:hypothetical protein GCM10020000_32660 [Streptomyces olivoverticillatus]